MKKRRKPKETDLIKLRAATTRATSRYGVGGRLKTTFAPKPITKPETGEK